MAKSLNPNAGHNAEWWKQRIDELNRKNCNSGKELQDTVTALIEANTMYAREMIVKAVVDAFANLVANTPVDTGRARAAWQISTNDPSSYLPPDGKYPEYQKEKEEVINYVRNLAWTQMPAEQLSKADAIYITNRVEYILALEAGWSVQAPQGFIALFLQQVSRQLNQLAAKL